MHYYQAADEAEVATTTATATADDATEVAYDATAATDDAAEVVLDAAAGKSIHSLEETISNVLSRYT